MSIEVTPDQKSGPRIIDRKAGARKLHRDRRCRRCKAEATQAHHIVRKGSPHFGDDVESNMMPLCTECHVFFHSKGATELRLNLDELQYVEQKLGEEKGRAYLERFYLWAEDV